MQMKQQKEKDFYKSKLSNGIPVVAANIPYLRSISIGIWVKAGSRNEIPELNGIFHFLEHLAFKGTKRRSAHQIAAEMDSIGGHMNAFTSRECTCYTAKVLDEHFPIAIDVLSDILLNSVFDPKEIERERRVILEEINMVEDTPDDLIFDMLYQNLWSNHSLGLPTQGFHKTVKKISRQDILSHMERFYSSNNVIISIAGNIDFSDLMDLLEKHFCKFKSAEKNDLDSVQEMKVGTVSKYKKLEQVHICLAAAGIKTNDKQRYECYLLNTILGGSMSSRLFQKIREEKGLAYSVNSINSNYRDTGIFMVYAATGAKNYATVVELIVQELKEITSNKVDARELEKAKNQLKGGLMLSLESSGSRMVQLAKEEMYFKKHFTLDEMIKNIDAVTANGIKSLANRLFYSKSFTLALLGPIRNNKGLKDILHN